MLKYNFRLLLMDIYEFAFRIGLAVLAGLLIGAEREMRNKSAGLKTNTLVSLGACVFILLSLQFEGDDYVDTTRVLSQVVTGIGFIGAGAIIHHGTTVKGLTTSATIWCSAGAGCLAALNMYKELGVIVVTIMIINLGFGYLDHRLKKKHKKEEVESEIIKPE